MGKLLKLVGSFVLFMAIFTSLINIVKADTITLNSTELTKSSYMTIYNYHNMILHEDNIVQLQDRLVFLNTNESTVHVNFDFMKAFFNYVIYNYTAKDSNRPNLYIPPLVNLSSASNGSFYEEDIKIGGADMPSYLSQQHSTGTYYIENDYQANNFILENISGIFHTSRSKSFNSTGINIIPVNYYQYNIWLPNKEHSFGLPILSLSIKSIRPSPDNIYDLQGYTILVWNSNKNDLKKVFVQPIEVKYGYEFGTSAFVFGGIVSFLTAIFYIMLDRTLKFKKIKNVAKKIPKKFRILIYALIILGILVLILIFSASVI